MDIVKVAKSKSLKQFERCKHTRKSIQNFIPMKYDNYMYGNLNYTWNLTIRVISVSFFFLFCLFFSFHSHVRFYYYAFNFY